MRVVQMFTMIVLAACCVSAQNTNYAALKPAVALEPSVASTTLPVAPQPQHKVVDKKFIFVMGGLATSEAMRITTTTLVLDREAAAGAPWVGAAPAHGDLIAKNGLIFSSELLVAYEMKKPHAWLPGDRVVRRLWWVSPVVMSTVHFKAAAHDIALRGQNSGPGGCDSVATCEAQ